MEETDDEKTCPYIIMFITEFFGTGIMMYIGCMGFLWSFELGPTIPAFTFGCAILAVMQMFSHFTPVHINPAVSLAVFILGKFSFLQLIVYMIAQYFGAIVGLFLLKVMLPPAPLLCTLAVNNNINHLQAFFIEFSASFVFLMALAGATDVKNAHHHDSTPIRIGLLIIGLFFATQPLTGAGMNPARALGTTLLNNFWTAHWVYHFAPYGGMITAAFLYRLLNSTKNGFNNRAGVNRA